MGDRRGQLPAQAVSWALGLFVLVAALALPAGHVAGAARDSHGPAVTTAINAVGAVTPTRPRSGSATAAVSAPIIPITTPTAPVVAAEQAGPPLPARQSHSDRGPPLS